MGLKTTYYLRSLGASNIEKATVAVKKEVRGVAGSANSELPTPNSELSGSAAKRTYTEAEKNACSIEAMKRGEICEACQ